MQIQHKFKAITIKMITIQKDKGREIQTRDFYVVRPTSPTSTPPSFPGLRIPLSKPPRLQMLTLDFQGVNGPLQQEIIPNLLTQVYPNTYNHSK